MQASRLILAAATLATAAFGALADEADDSQFAVQFSGTRTRAEAQADLAQYKKTGVNPWSTSYNPLANFRSGKTRAQVQGEYVANRAAINALNSEDSGSAYLAQRQGTTAAPVYAAQPGSAE